MPEVSRERHVTWAVLEPAPREGLGDWERVAAPCAYDFVDSAFVGVRCHGGVKRGGLHEIVRRVF